MWIFTEFGFYSINRTPDGERLQFRARRKQDLRNLVNFVKQAGMGSMIDSDIMTIPHADYRWRLEMCSGNAGIILCALTEHVQYRNFKNHLHDTDQSDKLGILHGLWSELHAYQSRQPGGRQRDLLGLTAEEKPKKKKKPIGRMQPLGNGDSLRIGDHVVEHGVDFTIEAIINAEAWADEKSWPVDITDKWAGRDLGVLCYRPKPRTA